MMLNLYNIYQNSTGISIDSKKTSKGNIFFGIKGKNFDGSLFAEEALAKGAKLAVVSKNCSLKQNDKIYNTTSPLLELQNLAKIHRSKFKIPFVGITGSVGKTTTRELVNQILSTKYKVHTTNQNYNSEIGVPITILSTPIDTEIAIIEMGARNPGDIKFLCELVKPTHGIITNFAEVHLDTLKNLDGIFKVKKELYDYLDQNNGIKFINLDLDIIKNKFLDNITNNNTNNNTNITLNNFGKVNENKIQNKAKNNIIDILDNNIFYGEGGFSKTIPIKDNIYAKFKDEYNKIIETKLLGNYNTINIAAARCIGKFFKIENQTINNIIKNFDPYNNRGEIIDLSTNKILLDAYSSNFNSLSKVIDIFSNYKTSKKKIIILGDMGEQGDKSDFYHNEIIKKSIEHKFNQVILCGDRFWKINYSKQIYQDINQKNIQIDRFKNLKFFKYKSDLNEYIKNQSYKNCFFLIKANRTFKFETLLTII